MASAEVEPPPPAGDENDDTWLYGDCNPENPNLQGGDHPPEQPAPPATVRYCPNLCLYPNLPAIHRSHNLLYVTIICDY